MNQALLKVSPCSKGGFPGIAACWGGGWYWGTKGLSDRTLDRTSFESEKNFIRCSLIDVVQTTSSSLCSGVQQSSGGSDVLLQERQTPLQETRSHTEDLNDQRSGTLATLELSKEKCRLR